MVFGTIGKHSMKQPELSTYVITRQQFPFFQRDNPVFMENAGGSQVTICSSPKTILCSQHAFAINVFLHKQLQSPLSNASKKGALSRAQAAPVPAQECKQAKGTFISRCVLPHCIS